MKKVRLVLSSTLVLASSVAVPAALGSSASAAVPAPFGHSASAAVARPVGPRVSLQIKAGAKNLLRASGVRGHTGWITKGGTPRGKCSAGSAAGALDTATRGRWIGKYYSGIGIFIASILGVKPSGSSYWAVYVDGRFSQVGVCDIKLHAGERLLFQIKK